MVLATVISASPKIEITELMTVRAFLVSLVGPEFVRNSMSDNTMINPIVADNIDY